MPSMTIPFSASDLILIVDTPRVRQLTERDSDERQVRNGHPLVSFNATVIAAGSALGVVTLQTSERDLSALAPGLILIGSGSADITAAGTDRDWDIRRVVYVEHVEPTQLNAWPMLTEVIRRATQQAAK